MPYRGTDVVIVYRLVWVEDRSNEVGRFAEKCFCEGRRGRLSGSGVTGAILWQGRWLLFLPGLGGRRQAGGRPLAVGEDRVGESKSGGRG